MKWQFLDTGANTGAFNMEFDERLARNMAAEAGPPTLRLFRWEPWAISLGFNQDITEIDSEACQQLGFDIVRRPTGGRAILHAEELTYSVVMPADVLDSTVSPNGANAKSVLEVYNQISRALVRGLELFGVDVDLQKSQPDFAQEYKHPTSIPCFTSSARYEIEWKRKKLVGSAQRRFHSDAGEVVLQHGSILTGPAHRQLVECLTLKEERMLALIRKEMHDKTTDLAEVTGAIVNISELGDCIKRGFEEEWGIQFSTRQNSIVEIAGMKSH
jgi:lipoate-protein ligase A